MNDALYQEMQHPVTGVSVKSRKVRRPLAMGYRRHKECFTGTDAVSWLLAHLRDGTRAQASLVLQGWLEGNRIRRVGEHSSKSGAEVDDRNALFQFTSSSASGGLSSAGAEGRLPRAKVGEGALSSPARLEAALALLFPGRRVDCFARVSAARGKKKREREGHFLALIGGTGTPTLQLGRLEGEVLRVVSAWPLRAVVEMWADAKDGARFRVGVRREKGLVEYRFEASGGRRERDSLLGAVVRTAATQLRYEPKHNLGWREGEGDQETEEKKGEERESGGGGGGVRARGPKVSLEALEESGQSAEEVGQQQRLWEATTGQGAQAAGESLERRLQELRRMQAESLAGLERALQKTHTRALELRETAARGQEMLESQQAAVQRGEGLIRAIRGHEAQRERASRHEVELVEVLARLMAALSVPPRYLALLRDPDWTRDDPADQLAALRALDKVVTLENIDPRLQKMRAVSDRSHEYRALQASFADTLATYAAALLSERAASRVQLTGSPPLPFHNHLRPLMPLYAALPRAQLARLLGNYMELVRPVYTSELHQYFAGLLGAVRRRGELSILEAFHLALQAVWGLIQAELEFWAVLEQKSGAQQQLVQHLGNVFVRSGEELGQFVEYADRHSALDVIGMMVEATSWQQAGEPMQSLPAVTAISSRLSGVAQRYVQKLADTALGHLRESHMARGRSGPLTSLERLPAFLDNIHSYGSESRLVTASVTGKILPALLEYLESNDVIKELIKFDSSKLTVLAGRLENYHYLWQVLHARESVVALAPFAEQCRERWERNQAAYIAAIFEREFTSLHEYFSAVVKMKRTVPAQEIPFQPLLSRSSFAALNKKYNVSAWEKKSAKVHKQISKNIAPSLQPLVLGAFKEFLLTRYNQFCELLLECYGPNTTFAVDNVESFFHFPKV